MINRTTKEIEMTSSKGEEALYLRVLNEIKEIAAFEGSAVKELEELLQALEQGAHMAGYFEGMKDTLDDDNREIIIEMFKDGAPGRPRWS